MRIGLGPTRSTRMPLIGSSASETTAMYASTRPATDVPMPRTWPR